VRAAQDQGGKREWLVHPAQLVHPAKGVIQVRRDHLALKGPKAIAAPPVRPARFRLAKLLFVSYA
jgi:hypothetical protein